MMMEEVNDDTNGESSFEFVGGKTDENILDDPPQAAGEIPVSGNIFSSFAAAPTQHISILTPSEPLPVMSSAPTTNEDQYSVSSILPHVSSMHVSAPSLPPKTSVPFGTPQIQSQSVPAQQSSYPGDFTQYTSTSASPPQMSRPDFSVALPSADIGHIPMLPEQSQSGVWGWMKNSPFLTKVAEKAKNSVDSVITTLDPGMKEIINSGGDICVLVASGNESKVSAVREAFQMVFGKATVQGIPAQSSSIAAQPVGFSAGLKAAEERINNLRQQGFLEPNHVLVAVENFITEFTPENWFDVGCLLLQDFSSGISLQVYTQATPISSHFVQQSKDQTPSDYHLGWSGHAVTIGQVLGPALGVHHSDYHEALSGVSRREILFLASKTLAGLYKRQLRR